MSLFITRIELHGGTEADYNTLHAAMEQKGFYRQVTGNGKTYQLPTAEYAISKEATVQQVHDLAKQAAATTRKTFDAITTQSAGFAFDLREAK